MAFRKEDLQRLISNLNIPPTAFNDEDFKLLEKGGISVSDDSELIDTESLKDALTRSFSSIDGVDHKINVDNLLVNKLNHERTQHTLEQQKNKYAHVVMGLEKRILELEHEKNRIRLEKEQEIQRIIQDNRIRCEQLAQEARKATTFSQFQSKRNLLNIVSDVVNGAIPEVEYFRLRDIPERELREEEAHLVHVWEMIAPLKDDRANMQVEINRLREEVRMVNEKYQNVILELKHANGLLERKDDDVKRSIVNYETSIQMLQSELNKAHIDLEALRDKGTKFDELYRDYVVLEKEKIMLENKVSFFSGIKDVKHEVPKNQDDLKAKYAILCTDKDYLSRENVRLTEQINKLEDKIERLENELDQTRKMSKDYITEMMNSKSNFHVSYEKKISEELSELKEKQREELETVKENLKDIYERQINFLKDNKEELELKVEKLSSENREKIRAYEEILTENRSLQRRVNIDLSELRVQLRIKTDELERLQNLYEEALSNSKTLKYENDMLREKNNILKGEYYKLEANMKEDTAGIRAQLAVAKEQLSNYEAIENEIDRAVTGLGQLNEVDSSSLYIQTLHGAPTASKRRIQQAIALGQRLNAKQKECEELLTRLSAVEKHRDSLEQELQLAKSLLSKTDQPYSYLIQNIEEKEIEFKSFKERNKLKEEEYQALKVEHEQLLQDYGNIQKELNKVMIKRENIKKIQQVLINLLQEDRENYTQNDIHLLIEEINAITENFNTKSFQPGKQVTINSNFYGKSQMMETPTRDLKGSKTNVFMQNLGDNNMSSGPKWYSKLKETLRK